MTTAFQSLRESLLQLGALGADLGRLTPVTSKVIEARDLLAQKLGLPDIPSPEEQDALFQRFKRWLERHGPEPSSDDWNLAPFVYFRGDPQLCAHPAFADGVAQRLEAESRPRVLKRAIYVYLRDFEADRATVVALGQLVMAALSRHETPALTDWRLRAAEPRSVFQPSGLADRLAREIISEGIAPRALMRDLGLSTELAAHCGLHRPLADALVTRFAPSFAGGQEVAATVVQEIVDFQRSGDTLRFPDLKASLAEGLLTPFASTTEGGAWVDPPEPVRAVLTSFFDRPFFGAPRNVPQNWAGVSPAAQGVISRWLVRKSLETFFDILSRTADPIWRYRRSFWLALYRRGLIEDAWPAFGNSARYLVGSARARSTASGRLIGAQGPQSVMIMKMRGFIVAEWSHAGACRIWANGDARAPAVGLEDYRASDLRQDCLYKQDHFGSMSGGWQLPLSTWIAQRTGVRVALNELLAGANA